MTTKEQAVLLPCPFCGSKAEEIQCTEQVYAGGYAIQCSNPMCYASTKVYFGEMTGMIDSWNTRSGANRWREYPKEKMESGQCYLMQLDNGLMVVRYYDQHRDYFCGDVTAWQPLPPPHTKGE